MTAHVSEIGSSQASLRFSWCSMAANESVDWDLGKAPKQSITEVLQDPRGPALELPDISNLELSTSSLALTPITPINLPSPLNINHFETYLRRYGPLHTIYQRDVHRSSPFVDSDIVSVPRTFFESDFDVAAHVQIPEPLQSTEQPLSSNPDLADLRDALSADKQVLERRLTAVLAKQSQRIETALSDMRTLRKRLRTTAAALRQTRADAAALSPSVTKPISAVRDLTLAKENVQALRMAATRLADTVTAPADVADLLAAGAYGAAIDRVTSARKTLTSPHISSVRALIPIRHRLANAIETIDAALRREFRAALHETDEPALQEIVALVQRTGRLPLLRRFFMKEIREGLGDDLKEATTIPAAVRVVKISASRAVMLSRIIYVEESKKLSSNDNNSSILFHEDLRQMRGDFEELLATFVDKILGTFDSSITVSDSGDKSAFLVLTTDASFTEESCFDEFKAALKFGEEIRSLEGLASDIESLFNVEKKSSPLRAKISEKLITFLTTFHRTHVDAITNSIRSDKWQEIPVSKGAIKLLSAVVRDDEKLPDQPSANEKSDTIAPPSSKNTEPTFVLDGDTYRTVACGVRFVRSVCAYTLLAEQSAALGLEIARRGIELSRVFNTLVCKAILGVAALQWSGLRSITARHLSLASRTIALAERVNRHVNKTMEKGLSSSNRAQVVIPLMRQCEKDLHDHHGQLLAKIVDVMLDRLRAHEEALRSLPWDKQLEMQRFDIPSAYVGTMVKETTVLHRILWYVLPQIEAIDIFEKVWVAYGNCLSEAYGSLDGGKKWIRERVARDVASVFESFKKLELSKVSNEAFKPIAQLYKRFAKEYVEENSVKNPPTSTITTQAPSPLPKESDSKESSPVEKRTQESSLGQQTQTANANEKNSVASKPTTAYSENLAPNWDRTLEENDKEEGTGETENVRDVEQTAKDTESIHTTDDKPVSSKAETFSTESEVNGKETYADASEHGLTEESPQPHKSKLTESSQLENGTNSTRDEISEANG